MDRNRKRVTGGLAVALAIGMVLAGVGGSAAYYSDTVSGGSIIVSASPSQVTVLVDTGLTVDSLSATNTPDLDLGKATPNSTVSGSFEVKNTGNGAQDVHIQFTDPAELDELNNELKQGSSLEISVEGSPTTLVFDKNNPLPQDVLLVSGLQPGVATTVTLTYHAGKSTAQDDQAKAFKEITLPYSIVATNGESSDTNSGGVIAIEVKA